MRDGNPGFTTPGAAPWDLKPSNVYVMTNDEVAIEGREVEYVLLGDFGLAWRREDKVSAVGTPEYCSPEQAADEAPTVRSDFYSLGVPQRSLARFSCSGTTAR